LEYRAAELILEEKSQHQSVQGEMALRTLASPEHFEMQIEISGAKSLI
jgi:hypothetical protein